MSKQESIEEMIDALTAELEQTVVDYEQAVERFRSLAEKSGVSVMELEEKVSSKNADFSIVLGRLLGIYGTIQTLKVRIKDS